MSSPIFKEAAAQPKKEVLEPKAAQRKEEVQEPKDAEEETKRLIWRLGTAALASNQLSSLRQDKLKKEKRHMLECLEKMKPFEKPMDGSPGLEQPLNGEPTKEELALLKKIKKVKSGRLAARILRDHGRSKPEYKRDAGLQKMIKNQRERLARQEEACEKAMMKFLSSLKPCDFNRVGKRVINYMKDDDA